MYNWRSMPGRFLHVLLAFPWPAYPSLRIGVVRRNDNTFCHDCFRAIRGREARSTSRIAFSPGRRLFRLRSASHHSRDLLGLRHSAHPRTRAIRNIRTHLSLRKEKRPPEITRSLEATPPAVHGGSRYSTYSSCRNIAICDNRSNQPLIGPPPLAQYWSVEVSGSMARKKRVKMRVGRAIEETGRTAYELEKED